MADRSEAPAGPPSDSLDESSARSESVLPAEAVDSWRTWLLTGHSGVVTDRRRVRGSHRGLKQMLAEGTSGEIPRSWKHFSGAMVRLAINDALNALPKDQTHVVWLAYFGGLPNHEIARRLGLSVGGVQRRLKVAIEHVSEYVEHGRTAGRRVVLALLGWFSLRRLAETNHLVVGGAAVAANITAAVIVGVTAQPVATPPLHPITSAHAAAPANLTSRSLSPGVISTTDSVTQKVSAAVKSAGSKVVPGKIAVPSAPVALPLPPLPTLPLP
ncbi:MAG TPA: sigma-70 family RNA polymerase sigma factor [Candidatus Dormibacteraeota bacterium]|nr:sigma-70 family RNA polymerase sigma factor [Candidatus Dormibacteraeota bacterium]